MLHAVPPRNDDEEEDTSTRLFTMEQKKDIFKRYFEWVQGGRKHADSPINELVEAYGCSRPYPKRIFDKVLENGTAENGAGVCPYMEREVEAAGAKNQAEIRAAVKAAWAKLTDADCVKISKKVRSNMLKVIAQKGGNFFRG